MKALPGNRAWWGHVLDGNHNTMDLQNWNQLTPGDYVRTSSKLFEVITVERQQNPSPASVNKLELQRLGTHVDSVFKTADYKIYDLAASPKKMAEQLQPKGGRLARSLAAAWAAFRSEWAK